MLNQPVPIWSGFRQERYSMLMVMFNGKEDQINLPGWVESPDIVFGTRGGVRRCD